MQGGVAEPIAHIFQEREKGKGKSIINYQLSIITVLTRWGSDGETLSVKTLIARGATIVSTSFPPLLQYFGLGAAYGIYTIAAAISFFFVLFLLKETKGIELEDM